VFFLVTNIDYDVVSTKDGGSLSDVYIGSTVGEMGCWVDPRTTKMIQTGLEQSRVPDVATEGKTGIVQYFCSSHLSLESQTDGHLGRC
jgi:hypothetical protein